MTQLIQFFKANEKTYQSFGPYWLALAEAYYRIKDYSKCLDAVSEYERIQTRIFRKDYDFAKTLTIAIIAAREYYDSATYKNEAERFGRIIVDNTDNEDWVIRYFMAKIYVELAGMSNNPVEKARYLHLAYDIALNNVNFLVAKQKSLNSDYLAPVYEPLVLNCNLLYALADQLQISDNERTKIEGILSDSGSGVYLITPFNDYYNLSNDGNEYVGISFTASEMKVPLSNISNNSFFQVTINTADKETVFDDWVLASVERKKNFVVESFYATYTTQKIKNTNMRTHQRLLFEFGQIKRMLTSLLSNFSLMNFVANGYSRIL